MTLIVVKVAAGLLAVALAFLFMFLSGLHRYWALGGTWLRDDVIPVVDGKPIFRMHPAPAMAMAVAFIVAALIVTGRVGFFGRIAPEGFFYWANWLLAVVFAARAVGDFRLVGFFKRVRETRFARMDTKIYTPLCLALAICVALIGLTPR